MRDLLNSVMLLLLVVASMAVTISLLAAVSSGMTELALIVMVKPECRQRTMELRELLKPECLR